MQYLQNSNGLWVPVSDEDVAEYNRLARYATVTFGLYGWLKDTSMKTEQAGSGVFVAPNLALTAKHVTNGILSLDPSFDPLKGHVGPEKEYDVGVRAYQVPFEDHDISWYTRNNWSSKDTDITVVSIYPDTPMAKFILEKKQPGAYFEWQLEPPPKGATVEMWVSEISMEREGSRKPWRDDTFRGDVLDRPRRHRDRHLRAIPDAWEPDVSLLSR